MKVILICLMLSACATSNEDVVAAMETCRKAGLSLSVTMDRFSHVVRKMQCVTTPHQKGGE